MATTGSNAIEWVGSVESEGGPAMVVDIGGFMQWTGATPFVQLREIDPTYAKVVGERLRVIHYWGQFTDRLPAPYNADGGHQFLECESEAAARKKIDDMLAAIKTKFPKVKVQEDEGRLELVIPGDEFMTIELGPASEYDASWQANEDEESWEHAFGKNARALFWEMEGDGVADVGVSKNRDELVLVRSWLSGEDDTEEEETRAVRALVDASRTHEEPGGEVVIPSGKAVVIWSPVAPFLLSGIDGPAALAKLTEGGDVVQLDTEEVDGVGLVVPVKPGRYTVTVCSTDAMDDADGDDESDDDGDDDDDDDSEGNDRPFSCRWCRLTWIGDATVA